MAVPQIEAKDKIRKLIAYQEAVKLGGNEEKYSEPRVKTKFIEPLLEALGWDPRSEEVWKEYPVGRRQADYALQVGRVGEEPKILIEAKKFTLPGGLDGKEKDPYTGEYITFPEKVIQYAWNKRVEWAILTNFKEIRVYNIRKSVKPEKALFFPPIPCDKLLDEENFKRIWNFSRESVASGQLETFKIRGKRKPVNRQFLNDLIKCRLMLIDNIRKNNKLGPELLKECAQRILDRLVIMRAAEDLGVETADLLRREILKEKGGWYKFKQYLFRNFHRQFNSRIFSKHKCDELEIGDQVIKDIVKILYYGTEESSGYNFDQIPADILSSMYEDYIGYILRDEGEIYKLEKEMEKRRARGIYYTPTCIVEYIVRHTVGDALQKKSPSETRSIHVLDPACGSGSFLIKVQDILKRYREETKKQLIKNEGEKLDLYVSEDYAVLSKDIITQNIYGVDLDSQAAEIASVNLSLKVLADMGKVMKLPEVMGENIKIGNSLVFGSRDELVKFFGGRWRKTKPMNWEREFHKVFRGGGFDIVVGNPPWGADLSEITPYLESKFDLAKGQYDSYELFIELSKKLLKKGGLWGFVIPDSIFKPEHKPLRKFLSTQTQIERIVKLGEGFFKEVFRSAVIIIFRNQKPKKGHKVRALNLMKEDRKKLIKAGDGIDLTNLETKKSVFIPQERFIKDKDYNFDIFTTEEDAEIMASMESNTCDWSALTTTGRGVEFSQSGLVIQCPNCFKWDNPPRKRKGKYSKKKCTHCQFEHDFKDALRKEKIVADKKEGPKYNPFITGKAVNRYRISSVDYIDVSKDGINYKEPTLYEESKLLVRKTGVGIYATIDKSNAYVPQAVFIFKLKPKELRSLEYEPYALEYLLGSLNSRLMLYYYYKKFGELEWKSFPYVTQKTIMQLPIKKIDFKNPKEKKIHDEIVRKVKKALKTKGKIPKALDYEIEDLVMKLYSIGPQRKMHIWNELGKVQKLRIIREMFD